jgi:heme oxygenase
MGSVELLAPEAANITRRFRLRNATRAEHARLDALITGAGFLTSRPRYLAYLSATLVAREAVERALDTAGADEIYPDWPRRRIAMNLRQDLQDIDHPAAPVSASPAFAVSNRAGILGALYVLEGASLGARLLQTVAADLGMSAAFGARHMATQTADRTVWPRFTSLLDTAELDRSGETECARTAVRVFERFEHAYRDAMVGA